jgi:hypothetical protein
MRAEDVEVLYAHHVLGFSISELAVVTGGTVVRSMPGAIGAGAGSVSECEIAPVSQGT